MFCVGFLGSSVDGFWAVLGVNGGETGRFGVCLGRKSDCLGAFGRVLGRKQGPFGGRLAPDCRAKAAETRRSIGQGEIFQDPPRSRFGWRLVGASHRRRKGNQVGPPGPPPRRSARGDPTGGRPGPTKRLRPAPLMPTRDGPQASPKRSRRKEPCCEIDQTVTLCPSWGRRPLRSRSTSGP